MAVDVAKLHAAIDAADEPLPEGWYLLSLQGESTIKSGSGEPWISLRYSPLYLFEGETGKPAAEQPSDRALLATVYGTYSYHRHDGDEEHACWQRQRFVYWLWSRHDLDVVPEAPLSFIDEAHEIIDLRPIAQAAAGATRRAYVVRKRGWYRIDNRRRTDT